MTKKLLVVLGTILALILTVTACQTTPPTAKGEAVFTVSDTAADISAVSDIGLTIDGLRARNESGVWTSVKLEEQNFMLFDLRDKEAIELLAHAELAAGTYDRLEIDVTTAIVIELPVIMKRKYPVTSCS
jgi:hypothetical protein